MTPDEVKTLSFWLIPGTRASFFDFNAANNLGPTHREESPCEGRSGLIICLWKTRLDRIFGTEDLLTRVDT